MDSINSVDIFTAQVQTSQPSLTKRGLELQDKTGNPSSRAEEVATQEITPPPQTSQKYDIDIEI